ncbi:MAG: AbrB/MazE/SpoVT family DNA-binding domain-containing protein [Candidatus Odinarchaeota archaeon]
MVRTVRTREERVSTVGIRNQVTLPKGVRDKLKIVTRTPAFIRAGGIDNRLIISLNPPEGSIFNRIKISEKGQLVIPKNFRESTGIKENTNLVFSVEGEEIAIQKLVERRASLADNYWSFLLSTIVTIDSFSSLEQIEVENDKKLVFHFDKQLDTDMISQLVTAMEKLAETRCLVETINDRRTIKLSSLEN